MLGDHGLARPGRGGDQHRSAGVEGGDRLDLEAVEGEVVAGPRHGPARTLRGRLRRARPPVAARPLAHSPACARFAPAAASDERADEDRALVEDHHRQGQRGQRDRVAGRGEHGHQHDDADDRRSAGPAQALRGQHAGQLQEHQQDRELEADAEGDHHLHREAT